jgi:hypothetical protein
MTDIGSTTSTHGTRGHTRTTWDHGLRWLFRRLREENPRASKAELQVLYMAEYREDDDLIEAAGIRVFGNDWISWYGQQDEDVEPQPQPQPQSAPARQQQDVRQQQPVRPRRRVTDADLAAVGQRLRSIILLDLVQPNGKPLRKCTGRECRGFSGWHARIADRVGDDGIVGEVLTEAEVVEIRDSSTGR